MGGLDQDTDRVVSDRAVGILHGHALSNWSWPSRQESAGFYPVGLGHEWICFGRERITGDTVGD